MEAACPMHRVDIGGRTNCIVSWTASPEVTTPPGELIYTLISFFGCRPQERATGLPRRLETASSTAPVMKTMRSLSSRE
jgi:hypothetical protein